MKTIQLSLEYKCFPMWIYEGNQLIKNDLVDELLNDTLLENCLIDIQRKYESLFIDDGNVFIYKGFRNKTDRVNFENAVKKAIKMIKSRLGNKYDIVQKIDFTQM